MFIPLSHSRAWIPCVISFIISMGFVRPLFRNPSRALYTLCFFLVWLSVSGLYYSGFKHVMPLVILQGFCLLINASIYPMFPFTEKVRRPSYWFNREDYDKHTYPYFTGYITDEHVGRYKGGFSLK